MHIIINALVEASSEEEALAKSIEVFEPLMGGKREPGAVFDGLLLFNNMDGKITAEARWGELPAAAPVDSDDGQKLLERGWQATKEEFERRLDEVKDALDELSVEEIMENKNSARSNFSRLSAYKGPMIFLYHEKGSIRNRKQLDNLLEESDDLWIVPADVHY